MVSLNHASLVVIIILATFIVEGESSLWKWLGLTSDAKAERHSERRFFKDVEIKPPSKYHENEYETYYVEIPQNDWEKYKQKYTQADGINVWEFPPLWSGNVVVPNFYTKQRVREAVTGEIREDDRVVQGLDNRWGVRLAVPFLGDFQFLREIGPGDFVPKLGPGTFEYPGPTDVDTVGGITDEVVRDHEEPYVPPPVVDLTPFEGLQNYPWYTR